MSDKFEETTAIITLCDDTSIDAAVLGAHLQRQLNAAGFELDRLHMMHDLGFRLQGPVLQVVMYLDQGEPNSFLVTVFASDTSIDAKRLRRDRFRMCSVIVEKMLAAVAAERVAMYHNGVSYVTNRGQEVVIRRDRSARLRQRRKPTKPGVAVGTARRRTRSSRRGFPVTSKPAALML